MSRYDRLDAYERTERLTQFVLVVFLMLGVGCSGFVVWVTLKLLAFFEVIPG